MASTLKVNEIQHTGGTNAMTVDSSGRLAYPAQPRFMVKLASNEHYQIIMILHGQ